MFYFVKIGCWQGCMKHIVHGLAELDVTEARQSISAHGPLR
jgi:hypothetical protein